MPTDTPLPADTATPLPTASATPTASITPTPIQVSSAGLSSVQASMLERHNIARAEANLAPVVPQTVLMQIAQERAQYMARTGRLTHYGVSGETVFDMMDAWGYPYTDGGENIHFNGGYSEEQSWQIAIREFLASRSHRATMLNPNVRYIGIGVARSSSGRIFYSVVFSD